MVKRSHRQIIFFLIVFFLFILVTKLGHFWADHMPVHKDVLVLLVAGIYTVALIGIYYLAHLQTKEDFWDVSDYAKCKGGPYFWQGGSYNSEMCRNLASTDAGMIGISSYNCPTGFVGQPMLPFEYTPLSDDKWQNARTEDRPKCQGENVGMCSMQAQV